jgi:two-component system, LytTR family, sensor kinase
MKITLPQYSGKDVLVGRTIILPYVLCMNFISFGTQYISSISYFLAVSAVTVVAFTVLFTGCGAVAVLMKNRFPKEQEVGIRLGIIIAVSILMSALFLYLLFRFYEAVPYFNFKSSDEKFVWCFFVLGIGQIFLGFLHEGISRYEVWRQNQDETEQLRKAYQHSRLQGLRSQVNPHFLFNSLNSLSSLISEEGDEAEKFLDEMSKVYRYMLRNENDTLVTLEEELKFLQAYSYLLNKRFGNGLQLKINIGDSARQEMIPPLTLQTIIENAFTLNSISKNNPLAIAIAAKDDELIIQHNLQPKTITDDFDAETALDNLISKYNLLSSKGAIVKETAGERIIILPLLTGERREAI